MNLKKFNTILLSITLSLAIIILTIGLYEIIKEIIPSRVQKNQVLSEKKIDKLLKENKRLNSSILEQSTSLTLQNKHILFLYIKNPLKSLS